MIDITDMRNNGRDNTSGKEAPAQLINLNWGCRKMEFWKENKEYAINKGEFGTTIIPKKKHQHSTVPPQQGSQQ